MSLPSLVIKSTEAHASGADQVPSKGSTRDNYTLMFPSLSPDLPLSLKVNK